MNMKAGSMKTWKKS